MGSSAGAVVPAIATGDDRPAGSSVEDVALTLSRDAQQAFARLISLLPGRLSRAAHLQRKLSIDPKLAWQVFKVAKANDPLDAVRHMPSLVSIRRVVAAAEAEGVPADALEAVQSAVSRFDDAGARHADGRASFAAMVASIRSDDSAESLALQARRTAFRANCQLWGSQLGVFFSQSAIYRDPAGRSAYSAVVAKRDFRRLRADATPLVFGRSTRTREGVITATPYAAIDPQAFQEYGAPLLPQFCSQPVPRFGNEHVFNGWNMRYMLNETIGKMGSRDVVLASWNDGEPVVELPDGRRACFMSTSFRVPTEVAILEFLTHRPTYGPVKPNLRFIPELGVDFGTELVRPAALLPSFERVWSYGSPSAAPPLSEVPTSAEITTHVLDRLGWPANEFDVHRVTINHPLLNTIAVMWFELATP